jgi:hypothetical protein
MGNCFFYVLPALDHHTYSEDGVEGGGIKMKMGGGRKKGKK